jgi:hypothetical protein
MITHTFDLANSSPGVWTVRHGRTKDGVTTWYAVSSHSGESAYDDALAARDFYVQRQTNDSSFGDRMTP